MKITTFFLLALLLPGMAYGQCENKESRRMISIRFLGFVDDSVMTIFDSRDLVSRPEDENLPRPDKEWINSHIKIWKVAVCKAAALLPDNAVEKLNKPVQVLFFIDRTAWPTGIAKNQYGTSAIYINLLPSFEGADWMTWDPLVVNGFSWIEKLGLVLHELGHVYEYQLDLLEKFISEAYNRKIVSKTTPYAELRGAAEDFAESFCLYILDPNYLKKYPPQYTWMKEFFTTSGKN
ncbi:hypothetical protein KW791_04020 [Candidatus Parcubacteria bacterium]|nr:hypothetical protein [Candidatus Parcubacteria bacterium]